MNPIANLVFKGLFALVAWFIAGLVTFQLFESEWLSWTVSIPVGLLALWLAVTR